MKKFLLSIFAVMLAVFSVQAQTWTKVTDASTLKAGDEVVIVASKFNYALSKTQNSNNRAQAVVTKNGDNVTFGDDVQILTLESGKTAGTFALNTGNGYLYAASSSKNYLRTETTLSANSSWKITIVNEVATIKATGSYTRNWLKYNSSNNPPIFSCYSSGQADVSLYRKEISGGETPEPEAPVATLPTVSEENDAKIALGTEITITPAAGNTVKYAIDDSDEFIEITEAQETITADVAGVMTLSVVSTCGEASVEAEYVYYVMPNAPEFTPAAGSFEDESLEVSIEAVDGDIYYTLDGNDPTEESTLYKGAFTITETTTVKAIAVVDGVASEVETAKYSKTVVIEGAVVDVLNRELTGISGTSYSSWSGKTVTSDAVYAGQSAGGNDAIQLRSSNNNSGVITTASGGKVRKVAVEWQSGTSNGRTLNVYGKNSAYSAPTDLYDNSKQGTLLGTIVRGTSTELVIEGDYEYIGMRSASGAMYLTSISITWDESAGVTPVAPNAPVLPAPTIFKGSMLVEITGIAADATVYYTTDGTTPSKTNGKEYTAPFEITATTTVNAVAVNEVGASEMATATYTLFVVEETTGYYVEVVSAPADWSGKYLIVYEDGTNAYVFNGKDEPNGYVSAVTDGDVIKANSEIDAVAVTIAAMEGGYSISTVSGYMYKTAYSNGVDFGETAKAANTFEIAEDGVVITSGNNDDKTTFRYNKADGQNRFRYYKSGQQSVQLYKYVEGLPFYHTLTVSDAGYATLYLDFNVRIPSAVEAYTVKTVNDGWVSLTQVTGVIPSQTGIIVKAPAGDYKFFYEATATADVTGNLLKGTPFDKDIEEEAYVLGKVDGVVGLYKAKMTDGVWLNNAYKAYLPASKVPNKSAAFYGFDWNGTTGVEKVEIGNEKSEIYDLTGRRVEEITEPGIYIVNGKKVLVK